VIYVLSGSRRETARWAESQGHSLRQARHVYDAQTLPGRIAGVRFVELPGFATRRDRHSIVARLKRSNYRKIPIEVWKEHSDGFGGWYREDAPVVTVTATAEEPPASHTELVNRVLPRNDLALKALEMGAEEDFSVADEAPQDTTPTADSDVEQDAPAADPLEQFIGLNEQEAADELTQLGQEMEEPVKAHEVVEVVQPVDAEKPAEKPVEKPKKRGRRTNQQKAYDEALAAWESNGGSLESVIEARDALAARHPDDERLLTAPQSDSEVESDAEDDDALDF
jgi:hypothetical protein